MERVTLETPVEELVAQYPAVARFLARRGVVCVVCGDPFWGTLGALIAQKNLPDPAAIIADLNDFLAGETPGE
jgi:hypothetical protein